MVVFIGGATHTGKTVLAQRLLEACHWPYLSADHLKMGLIRSGQTDLTPMDDDKLTACLWPILREMAKTAIENRQNLIIEGCYIPCSWRDSFSESYQRDIRCVFLVMTPAYIRGHFADIRAHANDVETRMDDSGLDPDKLIRENQRLLEACRENSCEVILLEDSYRVGLEQVLFPKEFAPENPCKACGETL